VAEKVGQKLKSLADYYQVICITHLPQIACFASHHFRIDKEVSKGRTRTTVSPVTGEDRVAELARMLGGTKVTAKTLAYAREMISGASG
jgi:DNA repair protein RecN (Recombination protein N)